MWKYYNNISQLRFFIFYIIFPFSISLSTIRFIYFSFFFSSTGCPLSLLLFYSPFLPHSPSFIRTFQELFLSPAPSLSLSLFLLDSKTLSVIRKFSLSPSFKNIPGSSHLHAVAYLCPQPSLDGSDGFCLLLLLLFFFLVMIWLILKLCFWVCILIIWLCLREKKKQWREWEKKRNPEERERIDIIVAGIIF